MFSIFYFLHHDDQNSSKIVALAEGKSPCSCGVNAKVQLRFRFMVCFVVFIAKERYTWPLTGP